MAYRKMTRIFVDSDLAPGVSLQTTAGQAHYLLSVMRMKRDETLAVFNGRDGEFSARIADAGRRVCTLELGERLRPQRAKKVEAAEQSERLTVPVLHEPVKLEALIADWPRGRRLVFCDETGQSPPIATALKDVAGSPCAVLIGPEGGFADSELDLLRKLPFVCAVGLGPRVLRADTAALAALAVVQAVIGDWSATRSR